MSAPPLAVRVVAGALCGWVVAQLADRAGDPAWFSLVAIGTLAAAFAAAPSVVNGFRPSIVACLALATSIGMYLGVPETDHVRGVGVVLAVLALAEVRGRFQADALVTMALDAALVWAAVHGAVARPPALVGGLAVLGLLLVAPLVVGGQRTSGERRTVVASVLVVLQLVFAVVVARNGAIRPNVGGAVAVSVLGMVGLVAASRVVVGIRRS